ncbi:hypothetical protein [Fulvimarina sp. MAC8]|uniref:hypothetical protein n=1 Tax=Fulvimarina sp. MAC8 TaxID=3162874 RepID=UPI0032EDD44B
MGAKPSGDRLVNLEIFEHGSDALVLASRLEAYGLFVHVSKQAGALAMRQQIQLGGIAVMVRASDYETAKTIMEDVGVAPDAVEPVPAYDGNKAAIGVVGLAAAMTLVVAIETLGGFEGELFGPFNLMPIIHSLLVLEAIRLHRQWWTLLTVPIAVVFVLRFLFL